MNLSHNESKYLRLSNRVHRNKSSFNNSTHIRTNIRHNRTPTNTNMMSTNTTKTISGGNAKLYLMKIPIFSWLIQRWYHNYVDGSRLVLTLALPSWLRTFQTSTRSSCYHEKTYDFFYLPIDFKNRCNMGYAFINFIDTKYIKFFYELLHGKKWPHFNSEKVPIIIPKKNRFVCYGTLGYRDGKHWSNIFNFQA
jgi:hypothetical protein